MLAFDPSEINHWASLPEAPHQLPTLVRRLILSTVRSLSLLDIPDGSSVRLSGWDGRVECQCINPWVPQGSSAWELSCRRDGITSKANKDYQKRTNNPQGIDPATSTFVFVTSRLWSGKQAWVTTRKQEGSWADIRALDADDLAAWLTESPAIAGWFARLMGKLPVDGHVSLDEWWENWSKVTQPNISPALVIAGRNEQSTAMAQWIKQQPAACYLQGSTQCEAIAFLAATAQSELSSWGATLMAQAVVVDNADAWRSLERHTLPLVLIRNFEGEIASQIAVNAGHHVLIPLATSQDPAGYGHSLPKPDRGGMEKALIGMGLSKERARSLIRQTNRHLPILRRYLIEDAGGAVPQWAAPQAYLWLSSLVLIGQWDENAEGDRKIVSEVTGQSYEDIARNIADLMQIPDPPLTVVGTLRRFTCHEEAWHLLAPRLTTPDVKRFVNAAIRLLKETSPRFAVPKNERHLANLQGQTLAHSETLREGIARSLALIDTRPERAKRVDSASHVAPRVVTAVLDNKEWPVWATLSPLLPILAEAAPDAFLAAVENALAKIPSPLAELLAQEDDPIFGGVSHVGLLGALDRLAWSDCHFTRVAIVLAQLAEMDSGGQTYNRPTESLNRLFRPWLRCTEASDDHRLTTLCTLLDRYSQPTWCLLIAVCPYGNDRVFDRDTPSWRPWAQAGIQQPTPEQRAEFRAELTRLLLAHVGDDAERWTDLIKILPFLSSDDQHLATAQLKNQVVAIGEYPAVNALWAQLRFALYCHRNLRCRPNHPDAGWVLPEAILEVLSDAYDALAPSDLTAFYAWLFNRGATLPEVDSAPSSPDRQRKLDVARQDAIRSVYQIGGTDALVSLAEAADDPMLVGHSVVLGDNPAIALDLALQHAASASNKLRSMTQGIWGALYERDDWTAIDKALLHLKDVNADPQTLADIYLAIPAEASAWERLAAEETTVQTAYWQCLPVWRIMGDAEQVTCAIRKLIAIHRSYDVAASLLCMEPLPTKVVIEILAMLPSDLNAAGLDQLNLSELENNIRAWFGQLDRSTDVSDDLIAALELPLLGLLQERLNNLALHRQISRNPVLFADLIARVFKRADGSFEEASDDPMRQHFFRVLRHIRSCPGIRADGTIDNEMLSDWVSEAQRLCRERGREDVGNSCIGQMLANAPVGRDEIWPCEPVRDLLERLRSPDIKMGIEGKIYNIEIGGVATRVLSDGGAQERSLAEKYQADAQSLMARWPYTAQVLNGIASIYEREADESAQQSVARDEFGC